MTFGSYGDGSYFSWACRSIDDWAACVLITVAAFESYHRQKIFRGWDWEWLFVQENDQSQYGVIKGLHYPEAPFTGSPRLVRVIGGVVLDVAVDIREDSSLMVSIGRELSGDNKRQFYILADLRMVYWCCRSHCFRTNVTIFIIPPAALHQIRRQNWISTG